MKHTKEPWEVVSDLPVYGIYSESEDRHIVQTINQNNYKTHGKSKENTGIQNYIDAERIVSCVNACEGMENPVEEIAELQQQLTWRDVSEKPKEGNGEYLCKIEGKQPRYEILQFDCLLGWNTSILGNLERISRYLPTPRSE